MNLFFTLTFLAHQTLLSLDAVVRALIRRTGNAAAAAGMGDCGRSGDRHAQAHPGGCLSELDARAGFGLGLCCVARSIRRALFLPRCRSCCLGRAASWIVDMAEPCPSRPAQSRHPTRMNCFCGARRCTPGDISPSSARQEHNWLIPDNVQEEPPSIAARISPTNLGFLLNARQVACEFGYPDGS